MNYLNTAVRYGKISMLLHWSIAFFILLALASGFALEAAGANGHVLLIIHLLSGSLAAGLTIFRLIWKAFIDKKMPPYPASGKMQAMLIRFVKFFLLFLPAAIAISGIGMLVTTGLTETLPFSLPQLLPDFDKTLPRTPHGIGIRVLIVLLVFHIAGAFFHYRKQDNSQPNRMPFRTQG
ncbi:MAG: cytochrome b/b6 domain-containing protein [Sneathiellales bacterium]|nr:cytochrome b/b6 domain-containing protein [Sneathiellales bacterium]